MKDLPGFLPHDLDTEELEGLTPEEQASLQAARAQHHSCLRRFLGLEGGPPAKPRLYRLATWRFLQAVDNALYHLTGSGLEQLSSRATKLTTFQPQVQERLRDFASGPPRALFLAADQASTSFCSEFHAAW